MIAVIVAGGSGTRLWPLSTSRYPKHLLKLNGSQLSLLQHTFQRAKNLSRQIYVVTDSSHVQFVREQLPELKPQNLIIEPDRRGTASCIVASLSVIGKSAKKDEPIAFIAADHYIRDSAGFSHSFKVAGTASAKSNKIVLIGVEPDNPATGFGYIQKGKLADEANFIFRVDSFKEKPNHATAKKYVESGNYLWNCSYFVGTINGFTKAMKKYAPRLYQNYLRLRSADEDDFKKIYLGLENISIDYALIEKVKDLLVVPASFDWMDLGSFSDLAKAVGSDEVGNHIFGKNVEIEDVSGSLVQNHETKPVAVIGLDNCVVINTPDGILVARKDLSQKVGDVSKRFSISQ